MVEEMVEEMATLHSTGTWDLVTLPIGKSLVGCLWVYTVKIGLDGGADHLKARLVAKGYTQYMTPTTMTLFLLLPRWLPFVFSSLWLL